jgi:hypothetical protein
VVSAAINSIEQNNSSFSMCWYSFLKLLFYPYEKSGVILRRLLLLFSKPQNGCAEILYVRSILSGGIGLAVRRQVSGEWSRGGFINSDNLGICSLRAR